ncbi:TPA: hypothetical protein N0F65_006046 [Lagenidium giganteum]|uniref:Uncharacterized protein n=1 Tax=Lagenidium giganteum TaxID=4803 RepID=A0AAV2YJJ1_9STRA|nr:TPA: hypothetical protein N0F65_006046 [Lagenidium giganteum]
MQQTGTASQRLLAKPSEVQSSHHHGHSHEHHRVSATGSTIPTPVATNAATASSVTTIASVATLAAAAAAVAASSSSAVAAAPPRTRPVTSPPRHPQGHAAIAERVVKEEIQLQREVTHQAQRQFLTLRDELNERKREIEVLKRHILNVEEHLEISARSHGLISPTGHSAEPTAPTVVVARLKDQTRRQDAYKKKLRHVQERLGRQVQFGEANLVQLQKQQDSISRERKYYEDKVAQQRGACATLEHRKVRLQEEREAHAHQANKVLESIQQEIASRSVMTEQRIEANNRRQEMLRIVQSRPLMSSSQQYTRTSLSDKSGTSPLGKKDTFKYLSSDMLAKMAEQASQLGTTMPNSNIIPGPQSDPMLAMSSRRLQCFYRPGSSLELLQFHREAFFHVYETQYARLLQETGEADVNVLLDRFQTFEQTVKQLELIESDLVTENAELEVKKQENVEFVHRLRFSGTAEVEKRKKIRDFFEQMHHLSTIAKSRAKESFLHQLKTFSYVHQGIYNIVELLKCLDERMAPPTPPNQPNTVHADSPSLAANSVNIEWLNTLIQFCVQVTKSHPSVPIKFTEPQVQLLMDMIPDYHMELPLEILVPEANGTGMTAIVPNHNAFAVPNDDDDGKSHSSSEEESEELGRRRIKLQETETLQQVELLLRTLDVKHQQQHLTSHKSKQHLLAAPPMQSKGAGGHRHSVMAMPAMHTPAVPELDRKEKLNAIHAFFKEKRLRERQHELQRKDHVAAAPTPVAKARRPNPKLLGFVQDQSTKATRKRSNGITSAVPIVVPPTEDRLTRTTAPRQKSPPRKHPPAALPARKKTGQGYERPD